MPDIEIEQSYHVELKLLLPSFLDDSEFFSSFNLDFEILEHFSSNSDSFEFGQNFAEKLIGVFLAVGLPVNVEYILHVVGLLGNDQFFEQIVQSLNFGLENFMSNFLARIFTLLDFLL